MIKMEVIQFQKKEIAKRIQKELESAKLLLKKRKVIT